MRNVAILNNGLRGSTGNIAKNLHRDLLDRGYNSILCFGKGSSVNDANLYRIGNDWTLRIHAFLTRLTGLQGFFSVIATNRLLGLFKKRSIDTVYIVCIHGYYLNEKKLYRYVADNNIRLVHIMIDEYAYTGKCAYRNGCNRYLSECGNCPNKKEYPTSYFIDGSSWVFRMKKSAYSRLVNSVFVGPEYVVQEAKKSSLFKNTYPHGPKLKVLDEAIDMDIYYPRNTEMLRNNLGIDGSKLIISCVVPYDGSPNDRKGGRFFIELARRFENDSRYVFIHVGYRNKNKEDLPSNYIPIGYIYDQNLLAEYFSIGDLFVFPSLLDTMPNACLDALACGTPLLCFDTSGMPYIASQDVGTFVDPRNIDSMSKVIQATIKKSPAVIDRCRQYALKRYDARSYNEKLISIAEVL